MPCPNKSFSDFWTCLSPPSSLGSATSVLRPWTRAAGNVTRETLSNLAFLRLQLPFRPTQSQVPTQQPLPSSTTTTTTTMRMSLILSRPIPAQPLWVQDSQRAKKSTRMSQRRTLPNGPRTTPPSDISHRISNTGLWQLHRRATFPKVTTASRVLPTLRHQWPLPYPL